MCHSQFIFGEQFFHKPNVCTSTEGKRLTGRMSNLSYIYLESSRQYYLDLLFPHYLTHSVLVECMQLIIS